MKYEDLLNSHLKYGTGESDIIKRMGYDNILENVVIAPWWNHDMFQNMNLKEEKVSNKIYNFYGEDVSFSYIELKSIGAPVMMEYTLALGATKCKNIIFLGSAGSIDENLNIGDIVIPEYSLCGDGASRYLNKNLEDEFLKKEYPNKEYTDKLISLLEKENIKYHRVPNISIDTIFAQFYHIDKIKELGVKTIEMESANFFKCNELLNKNSTAIFCISDSTIAKKSLFSGRSTTENDYRHKVRNEIITKIVIDMFRRN